MLDILSLFAILSSRRLIPVVSSSPIFHVTFKLFLGVLQEFKSTGTMVLDCEALEASHLMPSVAHSYCRFHKLQFQVAS